MKKAFFSLISILLIVFLAIAGLLSCKLSIDADFYIFKDISECQGFYELGLEDENFILYSNAKNDKHLKDLCYIDFFAAKYTSLDLEFEIFAYTFENSLTAQNYFTNITGKNDELKTNFLISGGLTGNYEIIVIDEKNAYSIIMPKNYIDEVINMLSDIFTKKLDI